MNTNIQKWGHSLAVRIPKSFAAALGFSAGGPAEMTLENGAIVLKPDRERIWDLETLLAGVSGENVHPAWERGGSANRETGESDKAGPRPHKDQGSRR